MNWVIILLIVLMVIIASGIAIKLILQRKLDDIDGFNGIRKVDQRKGEGTVIGFLGDDGNKS